MFINKTKYLCILLCLFLKHENLNYKVIMTQQNLKIIKLLRDHGLRPTNQRVLLAEVLFSSEGKILNRHVTAESLHGEVKEIGLKISLATIYNTLNQFTQSGLLREVTVNSGASYFDTNTSHHYHIFFEDTG